MGTHGYDLARLRSGLRPFRLYWFPRLRSTNDHAAELRRRGELFAPAVVLTGRQTAGRGRGRNTWWSPAGCITATFVFPIEEQLAAHQLSLVAGLAVRNAAAEICTADDILLKWPNDVLHRGRKLAGLLCERVHRADLIGLGLNVNVDPAAAPAGLGRRIGSLSAIARGRHDLTDVLLSVAGHLRRLFLRRAGHPFAALLQEYDEHHALVGRRVRVSPGNGQPEVKGRCEGLDSLGRLRLRDRRDVRHIVSGQVET